MPEIQRHNWFVRDVLFHLILESVSQTLLWRIKVIKQSDTLRSQSESNLQRIESSLKHKFLEA